MAKRFQPYRPRVFISYAARGTDAETAQALREALVGHKVRVPSWRDMEEIPPGSRAIREIQVGIAQCDFFLLLVSPRSVLESRWCPRELSRADRLQKIIVPLILETVEPENWPLELEGAQWIDVQRGLAKAMPQIVAFQQLHDDEGNSIGSDAVIEHLHHVRALHVGSRRGFA